MHISLSVGSFVLFIKRISTSPKIHRVIYKMYLLDLECIELPPSADMHVHLRQDEMMGLVVPQIRNGGVDAVYPSSQDQSPM